METEKKLQLLNEALEKLAFNSDILLTNNEKLTPELMAEYDMVLHATAHCQVVLTKIKESYGIA